MLFVSLFNELCDLFSGYLSHENIGESNCRFGARGSPTYLYVVFPVNWKEFSARISLSALCSSRVGIGGSFFMFILSSSCGIFVHNLITSIETGIVFSGTFVFSKKWMK